MRSGSIFGLALHIPMRRTVRARGPLGWVRRLFLPADQTMTRRGPHPLEAAKAHLVRVPGPSIDGQEDPVRMYTVAVCHDPMTAPSTRVDDVDHDGPISVNGF